MKTLWILFFFLGFGSMSTHAQIFTDNRRTFSYTDDSTVMPGDVHVHHILFEFGKCSFYPEFADTLDVLVHYLIRHPNIKFRVTLHTDSRGNASASRKLTPCRAEVVASYLTSKGVPAAQFEVLSKGEDEPLIPEETIGAEPDEETREKYHKINRRMEVMIISTKLKQTP